MIPTRHKGSTNLDVGIQASAEPLDQPVVQYGPFVMTSREEIQKTFIDYQLGQNGFEKAHVWKSDSECWCSEATADQTIHLTA